MMYLPCPFCAHISDLVKVAAQPPPDVFGEWVRIRCTACDASGPPGLGAVGALEAWNARQLALGDGFVPLPPEPPARSILEARVRFQNKQAPVGTPVRYWTGAKVGEGKPGRIKAPWSVGEQGLILAHVEGVAGGIRETHVEYAP